MVCLHSDYAAYKMQHISIYVCNIHFYYANLSNEFLTSFFLISPLLYHLPPVVHTGQELWYHTHYTPKEAYLNLRIHMVKCIKSTITLYT